MSHEAFVTSDEVERDPWLAIELRHLAALATVAEHASFSSAAESLGYVQSAVSQQIGSLERIVGRRLVERSARPRSVTVTDAGRTLLERIDDILEQLRLAKYDIDALNRQAERALSFGVDSAFGAWLSAALFGALLPNAEERRCDRVERGRAAELLQRVGDGELDAAFVPLPIASGPFFALELARVPHVLAFPADAAARAASVEEVLERWSLIEVSDCPATVVLVARLPTSARSDARMHTASGPGCALALVRSGAGAAVVTASDVPDNDPSVTTVPLPDIPDRIVGMAWHRDRDGDPALLALREAARGAFRSLPSLVQCEQPMTRACS